MTRTHLEAVAAAHAMLQAGDAASALARLRGAAGRDAAYLRAMALAKLGRLAEADETFTEAVSLGAPVAEARLNQARAHYRADDPGGALAVMALVPPAARTTALRVLTAQALAAAGALEAAGAAAEDALGPAARQPAALTNLGGVLTKAGRPEAAKRALDAADALRPGHPVTLNNRASAHRARGRYAAAARDLRAAARAAPDDPDVMGNLARALVQADAPDEAEATFEAALRAAPMRSDLHRDLASLRWERGDEEGFLASFDAAPPSPDLLVAKGYLALAAKARAVADDAFAGALALSPSLAPALAGYAQAAQAADAKARWRAGFARAPNDPGVRLGLAQWMLGYGGPAGASEAAALLDWAAPPQGRVRTLALRQAADRVLGRAGADALPGVAVGEIEAPARYGALPVFLDAVAEALDARHLSRVAPLGQTLFGGTQTRGELFETSAPALLDLREALLSTARRLTANDGLRMAGAWSVRLASGGGHVDHIHPEGDWSSVCYVRVPPEMTRPDAPEGRDAAGGSAERPGWLRLGKPGVAGLDLAPLRHVRPEPGLIVVFPAHVWHGVEAFEIPDGAPTRLTAPADFAVA